ncbi:hypothetical protein SLS62_011128 [Diatrype stigma]|uniref:Uncharacterized protein n=1 Tax=Diatrype stigma TaxID=117547 RepID=A0AAN9YF45_9PEZI
MELFIFASLATHLPQRDDIAKDAQADEPDLGSGRAKSNITGYIFGVTPGLAIWIVFGLTKEFRQIMYDRFVPRKWRRGEAGPTPLLQSPWTVPAPTPNHQHMSRLTLAPIATDIELQLDNLESQSMKRRATPDPDVLATPLLLPNRITDPLRSVHSTN